VVLVGPTGAGKTALGIRLAEFFQGEIVSADSRQIYRDFNVGTGKPSLQECVRVKHHLISAVSPHTVVTAAEYARLAKARLQDLESRGIPAFIVGGTGLWIRALVDGMAATPPSDTALRARLEQRAKEEGPEAMHAELARLDPITAERLPVGDRLRVIRALEIIQLTGQPASVLRDQPAQELHPAIWLGVTRPRAELYARAEKRIDDWLTQGWLDEVKHLLEQGLDAKCPAFQALGYSHLARHLQGELSWDQTVALIKRDTRRYIKRQLTWFNANERITWFDLTREEDVWPALQAEMAPKLKI
ncbi:MAG: tRNA (adenosine(37)-N6)-dimethylallyltransferase MiaA, partial [Candidatus Firestonebacteria bacterium]|nr:tRNA (adenosine(37)-N6)-dimethylallyltransferase MiaA [Candidatus Firestonebacteria bacterium]